MSPGAGCTLAVLIASVHSVVHWSTQGGYNFISGPLADITILTAFLSTLYLFLRRHNCHVRHCWRMAWHPHPDHGHPVCKKHHPHGRGLPAHPQPSPERQLEQAPPS
jgi:hypothetical protein